jgi:hypothetical protein
VTPPATATPGCDSFLIETDCPNTCKWENSLCGEQQAIGALSTTTENAAVVQQGDSTTETTSGYMIEGYVMKNK